ncbi:MAG: TIR domain-containing protein [Chloroflexota bacterium]
MQKIFISYSRKDIGFVRKLSGDLEKLGYEVWWDVSDLRGGDDWVRVIPEAIEASQFFLVVLSPNALTSEWVRKEYTQALKLKKKVIPLMLTASRVPFSLNTINYVDFTSEDEYAASLNNLLTALGYAGEMPVAPAATLPLLLRRYAAPIMIGIVILLALGSLFPFTLPASPTSTPSTVPPTTQVVFSATETDTPTLSPTPSATMTFTLTPTSTVTSTQGPALTPSATKPTFEVLIHCVNSLYANTINVRSGPGTTYAPLGEPLSVGECLAFRARNEEATWLQIAPRQAEVPLQQYEGGWIFRELLGLGDSGPIDLPAVTLTPTPTPSETPTVTPTFTRTPTFTPTDTASPTATETPTETTTP